jgi:hypothetical protein
MAEQYFLKRGKTVKGPFNVEKLQALKKANKLEGDDDISQSRNGPWDRIGDVYKNILNKDSVDEYEDPGDDQYDDEYEEYADEEAHDYEPRTRTKSRNAKTSSKSGNQSAGNKGRIIVVAVVLACGGIIAICGGVLFMVFGGTPSVSDNTPLHFSTTDSETAFAFMASLPEFKSLVEESPSVLVNPVRRKAVAETLQERLAEFVNTEVNWQGALVSIKERVSEIVYFSAGPDPKTPILLFFRVQVWNDANDDAKYLRRDEFVLDKYTTIIGSSDKLSSLSFSATVKSIKVYTGREQFCTPQTRSISGADPQLMENFNNSNLNLLLVMAQYDTPDLYKRLPFKAEMDCPIVEVELEIHAFGQHAPSEKINKSGQRDPSDLTPSRSTSGNERITPDAPSSPTDPRPPSGPAKSSEGRP